MASDRTPSLSSRDTDNALRADCHRARGNMAKTFKFFSLPEHSCVVPMCLLPRRSKSSAYRPAPRYYLRHDWSWVETEDVTELWHSFQVLSQN